VSLSSSNVREGTVTPSLIFTSQNWSADQTATVTAVQDCAPDGVQKYQILAGPAASLDPNYIGVSGRAVNVSNIELNVTGTTDNPNISICRYTVTSKKKINALTWEYNLSAELTNTGPTFSKATAVLAHVPSGLTVVKNTLAFGAVASGETVRSTDMFTVRSILPYEQLIPLLGLAFKWTVTTTP
jgi:hypothetical protein